MTAILSALAHSLNAVAKEMAKSTMPSVRRMVSVTGERGAETSPASFRLLCLDSRGLGDFWGRQVERMALYAAASGFNPGGSTAIVANERTTGRLLQFALCSPR